MDIETREAERRVKRYFYDDGLTEIALGVMLVLFGGYFFGSVLLREGTTLKGLLDTGFVLLIVCAAFLVGRVIRFLKFRITYPRTGYVSYKKKELPPWRRYLTLAVSAVIAAALSVILARAPSFKVWIPALNGLLIGVAAHLIARRTEVSRFDLLAAASVVIGFLVPLAGLDDFKGLGLYYAFFGAAMVISGVLSLVVYLRRSRSPREDVHEP